jgi:hypothetical protein
VKASDILSVKDRATKTVHVKEWGQDVIIQELGLVEGLAVLDMALSEEPDHGVRAKSIAQVVAWSVIDENGERVFSDDDIPKLEKKSLKALMFLYSEIGELSNEDARKN